jgi:hypothetical protein
LVITVFFIVNRIIPSVCAFFALASAPALWPQGIVVNEYYNGNGSVSGTSKFSQNDFVEFAITQPMSASSLSALTFGDANANSTMMQGVFSFNQTTLEGVLSSAHLTEFLPGTLIVVKGAGLGPQKLNYNPLSLSSSAWSIELVAGQGALDHPETKINGNFSISTASDVVWVSQSSPPVNNTDTSGLISAIGHGSTTGNIARAVISDFGSSSILSGSIASSHAVANVGGASVSLAQTVPSLGQSNSPENAQWLQNLRVPALVTAAPEPSRTVMLIMGLMALTSRRAKSRPLPR